MAECPECDDEYDVDEGCEPDMCHPCAHSIAEGQISKQVSARDLTIRDLRNLMGEARIRLDQYIGMCVCPGMPCVTACRECDTTQDLVNRIRAFMQGRSP
jgi:hypothetical protein